MTKDDKTYHWCTTCGRKGRWVTSHKPSECRNKKDSEDEGTAAADVVMELVEGGFFAATL